MRFEAKVRRKGRTKTIVLSEESEYLAMMEAAQKGRVLWIKQVH